MNTRILSYALLVGLGIWIGSCAILQRDTPEKKAKAFMQTFKETLDKPDKEILQFYETEQSSESILAAIRILQNQDTAIMHCEADFNNLTIEPTRIYDRDALAVTITAAFSNTLNEETRQGKIIFYLEDRKGELRITSFDAGDFYNQYIQIKHNIQYASHRANEIKEREAIYALARKLEPNFDTLVWYAQYNNKTYFYAVEGDWNAESLNPYSDAPKTNFKMGLIDETGKLIVPIAYDLVGTIGAVYSNTVEVKSPNGYGYFSLDGTTLVPPEYNQVIYYDPNQIWIVENEGAFGYINSSGQYTDGFINEDARRYIGEFGYIPSQTTVNESNYSLCESTDPQQAGSGCFISPSFWVASGLFKPVQFGFATTATDEPIGGWTEYVEFESAFKNITDGLGVLIASFKERYLEGREEFYEHKNIIFTDADRNVVSSESLSAHDVEVIKVSESVVQVTLTRSVSFMEYPGGPGEIINPRSFLFYALENGSVSPLTSNRKYAETEFVKLTDDYLTGDFRTYSETNGWEELQAYPTAELEYMRNEILAAYGMTFEDEETRARFMNEKWYEARYTSEKDLKDLLSDVDKHNLSFLARKISERIEPM